MSKKKFVLIALVCILLSAIIYVIYSNSQAKYLFDLSPSLISSIEVRNGSNGKTTTIQDMDTVNEIVEKLNGFRYLSETEVQYSGWTLGLGIYYTDKDQVDSVLIYSDKLVLNNREYSAAQWSYFDSEWRENLLSYVN